MEDRLIKKNLGENPRDYTWNAKGIFFLNFINWLAGFIQGDGSFIIKSRNNELQFYISQSLNDIQVLYKIKQFLGYGKIRIQKKENIAHFVLENKNGICKLLIVLEGFFFGKKLEDFLKFYRIAFAKDYIINNIKNNITLNNAWLSGFIDADGSFYVSINKHKKMFLGYQIQIRFAISQKDITVLKHISGLFNSCKVKYNKKGFYYIILSNMNDLSLIIKYIRLFPLKTKKAISFRKWLKVYKIMEQKIHLSEVGLKAVMKIAKSINKN